MIASSSNWLHAFPGEIAQMKLSLKVVPGSSRECIAGWLGETLKVRVKSAPEHGKANAAVERVVAEALGLSPGLVRIVAGGASPRKIVEIAGLDDSEILLRLKHPAAEP